MAKPIEESEDKKIIQKLQKEIQKYKEAMDWVNSRDFVDKAIAHVNGLGHFRVPPQQSPQNSVLEIALKNIANEISRKVS